eukprot:scaffold897_cov402-Prasinococcus_capsulatus_cf.AAC.9
MRGQAAARHTRRCVSRARVRGNVPRHRMCRILVRRSDDAAGAQKGGRKRAQGRERNVLAGRPARATPSGHRARRASMYMRARRPTRPPPEGRVLGVPLPPGTWPPSGEAEFRRPVPSLQGRHGRGTAADGCQVPNTCQRAASGAVLVLRVLCCRFRIVEAISDLRSARAAKATAERSAQQLVEKNLESMQRGLMA